MPVRFSSFSVRNITISVVVAILTSLSLLLGLSHVYLKNLTENYVESWLAAETINIDQGQLLPVFIKSQRMLLSSKMISGIAVVSYSNLDLGSPEYLIEFGDKIRSDQLPKENALGLSTSSAGLFTYLVQYPMPHRPTTVALFLSRWPSAIFEYTALLSFVLVLALMIAGYVYFLLRREAEVRDVLLKEGLARLVRDEDPGPLIASEVPSIVGSWNDMRSTMQSYKKKEMENHLQLQFSSVAKQVAHDIRSPLSALRIGVDKLRQVAPDASELIAQAAARIEATADGLVNRAKTNAEPLQATSLKSLAEGLVAEKRLEFHLRKDIALEVLGEDLTGWVQPRALQTILSNLINNSMEAMQSGGRIVIEIVQIDSGIQLRVSDNGSGIAPDVLEKLGSTAISSGKEATSSGLGIGVLSAKQKIESWGGRLTVRSELGKGTQVTLEFKSYDEAK